MPSAKQRSKEFLKSVADMEIKEEPWKSIGSVRERRSV